MSFVKIIIQNSRTVKVSWKQQHNWLNMITWTITDVHFLIVQHHIRKKVWTESIWQMQDPLCTANKLIVRQYNEGILIERNFHMNMNK